MMTLAERSAKLKYRKRTPPFRQTTSNLRSLPTAWLMTDERLTDPRQALKALPVGGAVILRAKTAKEQRALMADLAPLARQRRIAVLVAGDWRLAAEFRLTGVHLPEATARHGLLAPVLLWAKRNGSPSRLLTTACHDRRALARARALGASAATLSPLFPTRSHPGAATLGPHRAAALIRQAAPLPVIALGGITTVTALHAVRIGCAGLAAIDGWASLR